MNIIVSNRKLWPSHFRGKSCVLALYSQLCASISVLSTEIIVTN